MFQVGDQTEVIIEKMSLHGGGVARVNGLVVFVPYSAAGDHLNVEITEIKKKFVKAKIITVLSPSQDRINPPCPVFATCGGCSWQHINYNSQLNWKQKLVEETLRKSWQGPIPFLPMMRSEKEFRYRNRIQLKKQDGQVGYFAHQTHNLIEIDDCLLADENLIPKISELKEKKSKKNKNHHANSSSHRGSNANEPETWEISFTNSTNPTANSKTKESADLYPISQKPPAFSQINTEINNLIQNELLSWSTEISYSRLWDLYCGSGNFTFPILKKNRKLTGLGVEFSDQSIVEAQKIQAQLGISIRNFQFYCSDVALFLKKMAPTKNTLVLLDPPRAGLAAEVIEALHHSEVENIFYLSCNPMTLARDLGLFQHKSASTSNPWRISKARCFDMFPQTEHIETLLQLSR